MDEKDKHKLTQDGFVPPLTPQQPVDQREEMFTIRLTGGYIPPTTPMQHTDLILEGFVPPNPPVKSPPPPPPPEKQKK
jgi:hypothetical protein